MIVVKLIGGLGNQMFQYAAGRALAEKHGVELKLDTSFLEQNPQGAYTKRNYELDIFNIRAGIARHSEVSSFLKYGGNRYLRKMQGLFPSIFKHNYLAESGQAFQDIFFKLPANTYLDGFWQNEKYFSQIREVLIREFEIKLEMPEQVRHWLNQIQNSNAVSVHIRRGDYVNLPSASAFHGVCSLNYYVKAYNTLSSREVAPDVFVFSDDLPWCKSNLNLSAPVHFVEQDGAACWDLFLMSCCKHNIIANSSFSWWAAWLNKNPQKRVILPEHWFNGVESSKTGIVAKGWKTMANT